MDPSRPVINVGTDSVKYYPRLSKIALRVLGISCVYIRGSQRIISFPILDGPDEAALMPGELGGEYV